MFLNEKDFFEGVDPEVMNKITAIYNQEIHQRDTVLFKTDDDAHSVFILKEGTVNLVIQNGGIFSIPLSNPGEVFGLSGMVEDGAYIASGICATDSKIVRIDRDQLNKIFDQHPDVGLKLTKRLGAVFSRKLTSLYRELLSCNWNET